MPGPLGHGSVDKAKALEEVEGVSRFSRFIFLRVEDGVELVFRFQLKVMDQTS